MRLIAFLLLSLFSLQSLADCKKVPVKIAVLDTGFGYKNKGHEAKLCRFGHKDFSFDRQFTKDYATIAPLPLDTHGHGTNIIGIIDEYAKKAHINYCIVVIKYYSNGQSGQENLWATLKAIQYASNIGVDFINYSGGGPEKISLEYSLIKKFIDKGGKFVAAAGNDNHSLDIPQNAYYPAMEDKRIIVVGNSDKDGVKSKTSNYGNVVKRWEVGENVTAYGITMTGTSQATAVATSKLVSESNNKCDIGY